MAESLGRIGSYELIEKIGGGSYGIVYKAAPVEGEYAGKVVALKRMRAVAEDDKALKRFKREARVLQELEHTNILKCIDFFEAKDASGEEAACMVLEYVDGPSLRNLIAEHPSGLPLDRVLNIMEQSVRGLAYSSGKGVVHRDIKPSNIMLTADGTVKVLDFGIAFCESGTATATGEYRGTLDYMAPDFVKCGTGFKADAQSDIFSLGVCFLEALTGRHPYRKEALPEQEAYVNYFRWAETVDENSLLAADHPVFENRESLLAVVRRCISPDRSRRYGDFSELLLDMERLTGKIVRGTGGEEYRVVKRLGSGGFGAVDLAVRLSDKKKVALKRLAAGRDSKRFLREARFLRSLQHPNIVEYYDFWEERDEVSGEGRYALVMEYLDGPSLKERIREQPGGLPVEEVFRLFTGYSSALQHCHEGDSPLYHRDIKPSNLHAAPDREPKVIDFGIARQEGGTQTVGSVPGTLNYMAPEFMTADADFRGDARSDLFSLGVALYESLTGRLPFGSLPKNMSSAMQELLNRARGPEPQLQFDHPVFERTPRLRPVLTKLLARSPDKRYQGAAELKRDLAQISVDLSGEETAATLFYYDEKTQALPEARERARGKPGTGILSRRDMKVLTAAAAAVLVAVFAAMLIWRAHSRSVFDAASGEHAAKQERIPAQLVEKKTPDRELPQKQPETPAAIAVEEKPHEKPVDKPVVSPVDVVSGGLPAKQATVSVRTTPSGATVLIDGEEKGVTPLTLADVRKGSYELGVRLAHYEAMFTRLTVQDGEEIVKDLPLTPLPATVVIQSEPTGAEVLLDGKPTGKRTPCALSVTPNLPVHVSARKEGYNEESTTLTPGPEARESVSLQLGMQAGETHVAELPVVVQEPVKAGTLTVNAVPPAGHKGAVEMEIFVDEESRGMHRLPHAIEGLPLGKHSVRVAGGEWNIVPAEEVEFGNTGVAQVTFKLEFSFAILDISDIPRKGRAFVDDREVFDGEIRLSPGAHKIRAEAPGFVGREKTYNLQAGQIKFLKIKRELLSK